MRVCGMVHGIIVVVVWQELVSKTLGLVGCSENVNNIRQKVVVRRLTFGPTRQLILPNIWTKNLLVPCFYKIYTHYIIHTTVIRYTALYCTLLHCTDIQTDIPYISDILYQHHLSLKQTLFSHISYVTIK